MVRVKICGITNLKDALMAAEAGADALGIVNIKDSKRYISLGKAKKIFGLLPPFISKIVVARPKCIKDVLEIEKTGAGYIQLHGEESPEFVKTLRKESRLGIIKAISVDSNCLKKAERYFGVVEAVLLDTKIGNFHGGTGKTHNWAMSRRVVRLLPIPVILAGGLSPKNIREAIKKVRPYAVDASSGIELRIRKKDKVKVKEFIKSAKLI